MNPVVDDIRTDISDPGLTALSQDRPVPEHLHGHRCMSDPESMSQCFCQEFAIKRSLRKTCLRRSGHFVKCRAVVRRFESIRAKAVALLCEIQTAPERAHNRYTDCGYAVSKKGMAVTVGADQREFVDARRQINRCVAEDFAIRTELIHFVSSPSGSKYSVWLQIEAPLRTMCNAPENP